MVDGKTSVINGKIVRDSGTHYFTATGTVPSGAKGALPLQVLLNGLDARKLNRLVALKTNRGAVFVFNQGEKRLENMPESLTRTSIVPMRRFYHLLDYYMPYPLTMKCRLTVSRSGEYEFMAGEVTFNKIKINGSVVFDNYLYGQKMRFASVMLQKDKPVSLVVEHVVAQPYDAERAIVVYCRIKGNKQWHILPPEWTAQY